MKPWVVLGRGQVLGGTELVLSYRDGEYMLEADGLELMTSRVTGSERSLARICCAPLAGREGAAVLVGGLGMGFTLRTALDLLPADARVVVAEISPEVVAWNRGQMAELHGRALDDPRVIVEVGDVGARVRAAKAEFDAIMLDCDNGPSRLIFRRNRPLYGHTGMAALHAALRPGGMLGIWAVSKQLDAEREMRRVGFAAEVQEVRARDDKREGRRGGSRFIYVGRR